MGEGRGGLYLLCTLTENKRDDLYIESSFKHKIS